MITEKLIPYLCDSIKQYWDFPAFTDYPGPSLSYGDVGKRIVWLHRLFKECGLDKGAKVALSGKNSSNWALIWFASVTYGASIVPILVNFAPEEIAHIVNHSDADVLFISKDKFDSIEEEKLRKVKYVFSLEDLSLVYSPNRELDQIIPPFEEHTDLQNLDKDLLNFPDVCTNEDIASINYTSGTTGFSKGVMQPHRSLLANLIYAREKLTFQVGAKVLSFLPLAHSFGCAFDLLYPFTRGNHINFMGKIPVPKLLLAALQKLKPNVVMVVPLLLEKIYKSQLLPVINEPKMKTMLKIPLLNKVVHKKIREKLMTAFGGNIVELIVGGAPMNAEVELFMKKIRFPFTIGYGMTECGPLISYAGWSNHRFESSGQIVDSLQCKIDSPDPSKIPGEVLVKGDNVFSGYYNNSEATAESLRGGWLYTGDIGTLDKDNFIYLRGRSKNMILCPSGENIYPELVEQKVDNLPYIMESLIVERDRQIHALVYPDLDTLDKDGIPESRIAEIMEENRQIVNNELADFSRITKIHVVNEPFQKTPTQKIKRYLYR
ncbi:MAG: AMP-binding protein [Candidatus Cloacimonadaceae bacterium]|jgi:long-chain acyl-CoA synthetase|nr:AMP-binding protein [Candidatus Cloacimonadota bacterium]MDX9950089.1 AMP-binding protein [Candidatus Syntrophosphaera sp.]NLN84484.1 long-chain fatty acid--CoA ligase [Candidatus Cloacimonadota bacterium]